MLSPVISESPARHLLLDMLSLRKGQRDYSVLSSSDWTAIIETATRQGVAALLEYRIKHKNIADHLPAGVGNTLQSFTRVVGFRNMQLYHSLTQVLSALTAASLPVIVLKGAYLAEHVYENIAFRPMDDVDLLVLQKDLPQTEQILLSLGYAHPPDYDTSRKSTSPHHLAPFIRAGSPPIEVHWTVPPGEPLRINVKGLWDRALALKIADVDVLALAPEDHVLQLCVHAAVHHRFSMGLKPLCDITESIRHFGSRLRWDLLCMRAREWNAGNSVYLTLRLAHEFLGGDVPSHVLSSLEPASFDARLLEWAEEQIFERKSDLTDGSAISPRLADWRKKPFRLKLIDLVKLALPSTHELARNYGVKPGSAAVFLYYPVRWKDLLGGRGGALLNIMIGDRRTIEMAELYEKLIGTTSPGEN
jgi:hypothetical protein